VRNFGVANAGTFGWSDALYLSADTNLNTSTAKFLSVGGHYSPLAPDSSSTLTATVTIPNAIFGTYYLFVVADRYDQIYEGLLHANNTRKSSPIQVILSPPPDLVVTSLNVPGNASSGQLLHLSYTVTNQGASAPFESGWTDRIFLSSSATFNRDSATLLQKVGIVQKLQPDSSYTIVRDLRLPDGISGPSYLYVYTDADSNVFEFHADNNNVATSPPIAVSLSPWPDLQVTDVQAPTTGNAGDRMSFTFTVTNRGAGSTRDSLWVDRVYIHTKPSWDTTAKLIFSSQRTHPLSPGESYTVSGTGSIPATISGGAYLYVYTDASQNIYERTDEGNNIRGSAQISITPYPPIDVQLASLTGPGSGGSGKQIQVSYSVTNAGLGRTLKTTWTDLVYLSPDTLFSLAYMTILGYATRTNSLDPLESYSRILSVQLPQGISGNYYLLVVVDTSNTVDSSPSNNRRAVPINVSATPLPDLMVTDLTLLDPPVAGQPLRVRYIVHNNGVGRAEASNWSDAVYISADSLPGPADLFMSSKAEFPPLEPGSSYTDTVRFEVPASVSGSQWILARTDYLNALYEGTAEDNNYRALATDIVLQPPADLIVQSIQIPTAASPGQDVDISWVIRNLGPNQVTGFMRDAVYLSQDTIWTIDDPLLGVFERTITIPPTFTVKMVGKINLARAALADSLGRLIQALPGIDPGQYHVIVRTDIRNNILETNEANNLLVSPGVISVGIPDLPIGVTVTTPLVNGRSLFYHVSTPAGASLRLSLTSDASRGSNELFARLGQAPTPGAYDYLYDSPQSVAQTVTIPETQAGDYYLLVHAADVPGPTQNISLRADTLSFQLTRVTPTQGGNAGDVTVKLQGARFVDGFQAYLRPVSSADTSRRVWSSRVLLTDASTAFAKFDLRHAAPGSYDIVFRIPRVVVDVDSITLKAFHVDLSQESALPGAFHVVPGGGPRLEVTLLTPTRARKSFEFPMTLEVANLGENDAPAPVILITSPSKTPIGLATPATSDESSEIQVLVLGPEGRRDVLPPGQVTSVQLFAWAKDSPGSTFLVQDLTTSGLPLNWDALEAYYQDDSSPADWNQTWTTFKTLVGPTWESFHAALRAAALDRAPLATDRAYAANDLLGDIFARASGFLAQRLLSKLPPAAVTSRLNVAPMGHSGAIPASITGSCDCQSNALELAHFKAFMAAGAYEFPFYPGLSMFHFLGGSGTEVDYGDGDMITNDVLDNYQVQDFMNLVVTDVMTILRNRQKAKGMGCGEVRQFSVEDLLTSVGVASHLERTFNFPSGSLGITLGHVPGQNLPKPKLTGTALLLNLCKPTCRNTEAKLQVFITLHLHLEDFYDFCPGGGLNQNLISDAIIYAARQLDACGWGKGFKIVVDGVKFYERQADCASMGCDQPDRHRQQPPSTPCSDPDPCNEIPLIPFRHVSRVNGITAGGYTNIPPDCPACEAKRYDIPTVNSLDPNEIAGPKGDGDQKWVAVSQTLPYRIRFENDPKTATAPAQTVSVSQKLDTTADARSVRLSSVGFGKFIYDISGNRSTYSSRLDVRDSLHLFVDVTAGVDVTTNKVFATFTSVDPSSGQLPTNPLSGFLPVDDSLGHGQGFVQYTIRPRPDAHTGDSLRAKATVVFDNNAPLDTPPYYNIIDAGTPVSRVRVLPPSIDSTAFRVSWGGRDDSLASGLRSFTVFVSDNDSTYSTWLKDVPDTTAVYQGVFGKTYRFFSIAADNAGNVEPLKSAPDAVTVITGVGATQTIPTAYALLQNYPNPFNPSTVIRFDVPERTHVHLAVYNVLGQLVMTLVDGQKESGAYRAVFDARRLATGVYIYRLTAGSFVQTRKMLLLK
jgi:subtilase family serine protease